MAHLTPPLSTKKRDGARALSWVALVVAGLCGLPMLAVLLAALSGGTETVQHLAGTVLGDYARTTLALVVLVAVGTFAVGVGAAWLVTMTRFPGARMFEIALVLPLAFPAYVLAYAYTHVLDHPGIVQTTLREVTGWGPREYWFPEIRSLVVQRRCSFLCSIPTFICWPVLRSCSKAALLFWLHARWDRHHGLPSLK